MQDTTVYIHINICARLNGQLACPFSSADHASYHITSYHIISHACKETKQFINCLLHCLYKPSSYMSTVLSTTEELVIFMPPVQYLYILYLLSTVPTDTTLHQGFLRATAVPAGTAESAY